MPLKVTFLAFFTHLSLFIQIKIYNDYCKAFLRKQYGWITTPLYRSQTKQSLKDNESSAWDKSCGLSYLSTDINICSISLTRLEGLHRFHCSWKQPLTINQDCMFVHKLTRFTLLSLCNNSKQPASLVYVTPLMKNQWDEPDCLCCEWPPVELVVWSLFWKLHDIHRLLNSSALIWLLSSASLASAQKHYWMQVSLFPNGSWTSQRTN